MGAVESGAVGSSMKKNLILCFVLIMMIPLDHDIAHACKPIRILSPDALIQQANFVVVATAVKYTRIPKEREYITKEEDYVGEIEFHVKSLLKGELSEKRLIIEGILTDNDDYNEDPVPYEWVRPMGQLGYCFGVHYKRNADFLLFLSHPAPAHDDWLRRDPSPYWASLAPTNEQLHPKNDAWLNWVEVKISKARK